MLNQFELEELFKEITAGGSLENALRRIGSTANHKDVSYWILNNEALRNRYYECQQHGIEALVDMAVEKSMDNNVDPVERAIILKAVQFAAQTRSRERYGAHVKHEQSFTIDIAGAMEQAEKRLEQKYNEQNAIEGEVVDEPKPNVQGSTSDSESGAQS